MCTSTSDYSISLPTVTAILRIGCNSQVEDPSNMTCLEGDQDIPLFNSAGLGGPIYSTSDTGLYNLTQELRCYTNELGWRARTAI